MIAHVKDNRGFALLASVFVITVFGCLGLTALMQSSMATHEGVGRLQSQQAFYSAESGHEYLRGLLNQDTDWSDNVDDEINWEGSTISWEYLEKDTGSANVKVTGTMGGLVRSIILSYTKSAVDVLFLNSVYTTDIVKYQSSSNVTIDGTITEQGTEPINNDYGYYQGIADYVISGDQHFSSGTYSGVYYVEKKVTFDSNVTINGCIIAGEGIVLDGDNISVSAPEGLPALVGKKGIELGNGTNKTLNGTMIAELDKFKFDGSTDVVVNGSIICGKAVELNSSQNVTINYDSSVTGNPPQGISSGGVTEGSVETSGWAETT